MSACIEQPADFKVNFETLISSLDGLLSTTGAHANPTGFCFELAADRERPLEFLQCLLDLVRVVYEPSPPGTMNLNSNWDLIANGMPLERFRLAYASVVGQPGQKLEAVIEQVLRPKLRRLGYELQDSQATFVFVAAGAGIWTSSLELMARCNRAFGAGFSVQKVMDSIQKKVDRLPTVLAGAAQDPSLHDNQVRVSLWACLVGSE